MALGDEFAHDICKRALLCSLDDPEAIVYRQHIVRDCLEAPSVVRAIYNFTAEAIYEEKRHFFGIYRKSPDAILYRSVQVMEMFMQKLMSLRQICDEHSADFRSDGFVTLFAMLTKELDDEYFQTVENHLRKLRFQHGALSSARLGAGNHGTGYVLHEPRREGWRERLLFADRSSYSFQIAERDESGARALSELRGLGINLVANAVAQSTDHILSFFNMLHSELGFYVGCLNLYEQLAEQGEPTCFPEPMPLGEPVLSCEGLCDASLSLTLRARVVGNDVSADGKSLVMITGANQGGKSTFLRSVGAAQLMMQCGMFVTAKSFRADVRDGVFTHFKREEDVTMKSGKLDEELSRMSAIVDAVGSNGVVLCNESFASTNEREGSEIARQIISAFLEAGIKVLFVTHMFDLAQGCYARELDTAFFLRAERQPDGRRTFRVVEGEPLPTSYGEDLYRRIFGSLPGSSSEPEPTTSAAGHTSSHR
ncbi:MAG: MutS-related protein [Nocardioidaceae bacterium]